MISIQCDEHIPASVVRGLQARGIDAHGAEDEALKGASDRELFDFCRKQGRVLLTNDEDFLRLAKDPHPGVIFLTTQFASVGEVIRAVVTLVDTVPEFRNGRFFVP